MQPQLTQSQQSTLPENIQDNFRKIEMRLKSMYVIYNEIESVLPLIKAPTYEEVGGYKTLIIADLIEDLLNYRVQIIELIIITFTDENIKNYPALAAILETSKINPSQLLDIMTHEGEDPRRAVLLASVIPGIEDGLFSIRVSSIFGRKTTDLTKAYAFLTDINGLKLQQLYFSEIS